MCEVGEIHLYLQIVMPTHKREEVLVDSLARYKDLPHLNKVQFLLLFWLMIATFVRLRN